MNRLRVRCAFGFLNFLALLGFCGSGLADVRLIYDGVQNLGNGTFRHVYHGVRDALPTVNIEDVHITGQFSFEPGQVNLVAPDNWAGGYDGLVFSWTVNDSSNAWMVGTPEIAGFAIEVTYPMVTQSPFQWTFDRNDPTRIVIGGTGLVNAPIPEPAGVATVAVGIALITFIRRRSGASAD